MINFMLNANSVAKDWRNHDAPHGVDLFGFEDVYVFSRYMPTGTLTSSGIAVLYSLGSGYCARLNGGQFPFPEDGVVRDEGGHYFCAVQVTVEELAANTTDALIDKLNSAARLMAAMRAREQHPTRASLAALLFAKLRRKLAAFRFAWGAA